jgi:hypothetical protein
MSLTFPLKEVGTLEANKTELVKPPATHVPPSSQSDPKSKEGLEACPNHQSQIMQVCAHLAV